MAPEATAMTVLTLARAGRFGEIRELFAPGLRALVSVDAVRAGWTAEIGRCGPVTSVGAPVSEPAANGMVEIRIPVTCEHDGLTVIVSAAEDGALLGLRLGPADAARPIEPWAPPDYADPAAFTEHDVTVGDGPLAVPGTVTVPRSAGPWPGVVLLGGSGPADRDATLGRNKPFRDLAWGLASRGIAVLRYEKVTYAHADQVRHDRNFTVADEYLRHAGPAVELLRQELGVTAAFVLGHSLGGTVAPRVAAADPAVAGLVILAGGTRPLHWTAVRQLRYLAALDPATATAARATVAELTRQAEVVDSPELSPAIPDSDLPFGMPAAYWLDLRGYDPVATAARLTTPMLILQGGRDYQVTVADDLPGGTPSPTART